MDSKRIAMLYDKAKDIESWGRSMGFDTEVKMIVEVGSERISANLNARLSETTERDGRGF